MKTGEPEVKVGLLCISIRAGDVERQITLSEQSLIDII